MAELLDFLGKGLAHALPCSSRSQSLTGNAITEALPKAVRELHKKNVQSCGMGILPVLALLAGFSDCITRNFGIFF